MTFIIDKFGLDSTKSKNSILDGGGGRCRAHTPQSHSYEIERTISQRSSGKSHCLLEYGDRVHASSRSHSKLFIETVQHDHL